MLRHSKGVHLVDDGVSLTVIKDLFGHQHISTTEIYARISTEKARNILEANTIVKGIKIKRSKKEIDELEEYLKKSTNMDV